jgi:hypothetical protein
VMKDNKASPHFRTPLPATHVNPSPLPEVVKYIVKDLEDLELGRANDARSAWDLIEVDWSDAVVTSLGGPPVQG